MSQFESSLGNKKFSNPSLKEIDVPDESGFDQNHSVNPVYRRNASLPVLDEASIQNLQARLQNFEQAPAEIERDFREAREVKKAKLTGKEKLNDGAKRRLEILLGMTSTSSSIEIDGNTYVMQTIPSKSIREAVLAASEYDGTVESPYEVRRQFLARSITQIAGVDFDQFVGSSSIDVKLSFIDELHEALLNRLYAEYVKMSEEAREKYAIKNEVDAKGIIDDLKK